MTFDGYKHSKNVWESDSIAISNGNQSWYINFYPAHNSLYGSSNGWDFVVHGPSWQVNYVDLEAGREEYKFEVDYSLFRLNGEESLEEVENYEPF